MFALIAYPGHAFAQSSEPAEQEAEQEAEDTQYGNTIIVTAQRREENLQEVPAQITAFTADMIEDASIRSTQDFVNLTPNMSLDSSDTYNNTFVVVRGVTQINNADAPVAIVIDGVPQNDQKQFNMNLFDVERIEVLKGPQGALYGRNAIGGAVNIVTREPTDYLSGFAMASYGRGDAVNLSAGISGPLGTDNIKFRLSGVYVTDNGRINNTFANENVDFVDHDYTIRGRITADAADWLELDLRGSYRDFDAGSQFDSVVFSGDANDFVNPQNNLIGFTTGEQWDLTFKADADLGFATLTSITGYNDVSEVNRGDLDFRNPVDSPGGFLGLGIQVGQGQDRFVELFSQELRFTSPDDQPVRWIAGVYYLNTQRALRTRGFVDLDGTFEQIDNPALLLIDRQEANEFDSYAVFGQLDVDLTDSLTLSAGLRYDRDDREQTDLATNNVRSASYDSVQPKVTLTYNFDDEKLLYATYATGFRSGGFNAPGVALDSFEDETLENFEVGFKTTLANGKLRFNGAAYLSNVNDFQFFFVEAATASQIISNIDRVRLFGFELEAQYFPRSDLQFFAALGSTDSDIREITVFPGNEGNRTPKTTRYTVNMGAQYTPELSDDLDGFFRIDYEHRGDRFWQVDNVDVQEPLNLLNFRLGIENDTFGVYFWGKNITGERFFTDFNPREFSGLDIDIGFRGQPATYGVEARFNF
ncbi:TonB-dependent receptor [Alterisphingorhabdus coralli]|uniref:TonB-dependent receptor n=1 Tax=Alterisphingorhabdus coralli TaxID=3071408 RepID=A0AA97F827_9SPHN|nr:TonB-dependent receptor [Parasphingorhabdus sp. SCSIO 66989]WOE75201.1 TonB-dependent receptor [Parasphingorhabdus sp. SCSIO 66989]